MLIWWSTLFIDMLQAMFSNPTLKLWHRPSFFSWHWHKAPYVKIIFHLFEMSRFDIKFAQLEQDPLKLGAGFSWGWGIPRVMGDIVLYVQIVVYLDQLWGAVCTQKLVKTLYGCFQPFFILDIFMWIFIWKREKCLKNQCLKLLFKVGRHRNAVWLPEGEP